MLKSHVDWRSDIYALGILAFEMLTGEAPFSGDSVYATMTKRLKTDPSAPSSLRTDCPKELDAVILKAMHRDPERRYQSGQEVYDDLKAIAKTYGYPMGSAAVTRPRSPTETFIGPSVVEQIFDSTPPAAIKPALPTPSISTETVRRAPQPAVFQGSVPQSIARPEASAISGGNTTAQRDYSDGTEILSSGFVDFATDTQAPIGIGEPPRIQPLVRSGVDLLSDSWDSEDEVEAPAQVSAKLRSLSQRYEEKDQDQLSVRDVVALGLAAFIGIACGLVFLRMVAPSLLAGINF
jgi:serine/threonine protein kinase